ncbi:MAG: S41 family peptidase [bacterium]
MKTKIFTGTLLLLLLAGSVVAQEVEPTLTPEQTQLNLESFDYVWSTIHDKHFDTTFGGLDWQAVHEELRPRVEAATTMKEARASFRELIARLGLSHFAVIPATLYDNIDRPVQAGDRGGEPGFEICVVDSVALVTSVVPGSAAASAGVLPGWEILKVGDEQISPLFEPLYEEFKESPRLELYLNRAVNSRLGGPVGDSITVTFIDGAGQEQVKTLKLAEPAGLRVLFGNLPPFYLTIDVDTLEQNIGYFAFSCFFEPVTLMGAFNQAMAGFKDAPGLIIDIRGNGGGIGSLAMGIAGWLVDQKNLYLGTLSTRDTELRLVVNPRALSFKGPVAVLVNGGSASSSEFLAGGLQDIGRARIFGTRTVGAALPSAIERLPNGDGFQYAFGNYVSSSGRSLEGDGVIPDEEVRHQKEALLAGRDLMLEAAVKWINDQTVE